jgi:hypothetical protein
MRHIACTGGDERSIYLIVIRKFETLGLLLIFKMGRMIILKWSF